MPALDTQRLFLAITLPESLRNTLDAGTTTFRAAWPIVRWVRAESLHLTLQFLGERPASQISAISAAVSTAVAAHAAFTLQCGGVGCFPNVTRPRVLWVGIQSGSAQLVDLQRTVLRSLVLAGLAETDARFSPHLTLGRVRDDTAPAPRAALGRAWSALAIRDIPRVPVAAVHLMSSELGRGGARYTALRELPLGGKG